MLLYVDGETQVLRKFPSGLRNGNGNTQLRPSELLYRKVHFNPITSTWSRCIPRSANLANEIIVSNPRIDQENPHLMMSVSEY